MAVEIIYTSCACNSSRHSTDWGANNLICFGACNAIAICDPKKNVSGCITHTLYHHKNSVNSARWIRSYSELETEFVSTSCDSTACLWKRDEKGNYDVVQSLEGHAKDVIIADGIKLKNSPNKDLIIVASASIDSKIKIWGNHKEDSFICFQTLNLRSEMCFELRFCYLPGTSTPLLICANTDCKIYLYAKTGEEFVLANVLEGHEDFVRTIDVVSLDSKNMLLASGDQAGQIRIWRISLQDSSSNTHGSIDSNGDFKVETKSFSLTKDQNVYCFSICIESVILAHDGMINGIQWHPALKTQNGSYQPLKLLSCSMDKTMILWEPDVQSGVWLESVRVGEIGGNSLGFFGCKFGPCGKTILAYGKQGSFHQWCLDQVTGIWEPKIFISGHSKSVEDIQWEPDGEFVLSVSADQTTRLHAPWKRDDGQVTWHEIARPQIHGHDMSCIAVLSRYRFASGSEEKVGRVFDAPRNFIDNFHRICKIQEETELAKLPQGASVPSLGLSNKAVFDGHEEKSNAKNDYPEPYFVQVDLNEPPTEEHLMQNTLWPEVQKLYGHGYDVFCMAAAHDGNILASACKSTTPQHAAIILWDAKSWKLAQKLESHSLTVTQMAFSPNDKYLLSVSRDRRWSIFERTMNDAADSHEYYKLAAVSPKISSSHSRIIWSCSWSHDSKYFVTSSRDGKAIVWGTSDDNTWNNPKMWPLKLTDSITATAFAYNTTPENHEEYVILLGTEGGLIYIYTWQPLHENEPEKSWKIWNVLNNNNAHHKAVKRLAFRPVKNKNGHYDVPLQFASCGEDHVVKVYNMKLRM